VDVTVHTGFPHYPSGTIAPPYRNRPLTRERREAVAVVRSAVYPAANRGFARRLLNHASFAASALATAPFTGAADVVVAETPPLFTAAAGAVYAAIKRAALVVNVADRWPASAVELGMLSDARAIAAAERLERWVYRRADLITAPTAGIVAALEAQPAAAGKGRRTWPVLDLARFDPRPPEGELPSASTKLPLRLLYAGTIGLAQGVGTLLEASRLAGPDVVETTIAGDGAEAATLADRARDADNVKLVGTVPAGQIPALYARADAAAVLLRDRPIFRGALPTKLLEAMGAGRPLLVSAEGEAAELVRSAHAGVSVPPDDPAALAQAIVTLHRDPDLRLRLGAAGRAYVEDRFGAERAAEAWLTILTDAAAGTAARSGRAAGARYRAD
jgi:glycosyltransferase involved in cell wall biosynthesis